MLTRKTGRAQPQRRVGLSSDAVPLGQGLVKSSQVSHSFCGFARMRRIVPLFSRQPGFRKTVMSGDVLCQFFKELGVGFVFFGVSTEVSGELDVILSGFVHASELREFSR
jgi:hypothetical protein